MLEIFLSIQDISVNKTEISALLETYIPEIAETKYFKCINQLHSEACYKVIDVMGKKDS